MSRTVNVIIMRWKRVFFIMLKAGLIDDEDHRVHQQVMQSVFKFTEVFYNPQIRSFYLGYTNPVEYKRVKLNRP